MPFEREKLSQKKVETKKGRWDARRGCRKDRPGGEGFGKSGQRQVSAENPAGNEKDKEGGEEGKV